MLEPEQLTLLFPFHLIVDGAGRIVQIGDSLARVAEAARTGAFVDDCFESERPRVRLSWEELEPHQDEIILIRVMDRPITLRGQVLPIKNGFGFFGSPWIQDLRSLPKTGLTLRDFALHNPVPDYLTLLRTSEASMNDAVRLAGKLKLAKEEADQANQAKSDFLAIMSHEIRTPLNVVLGIAELLAGTSLTLDQEKFVRTIRNNSELLRVLISDILDVSKMEAGQLELESTPFDLATLTRDIAEGLATRADSKGIQLLTDVDPRLPTHFMGDPSRIRQVLMNLLGNAVKFTKEGSVSLTLSGKSVEAAQWALVMEVTDTGIGIAEDAQKKIFERFVQASSDTNRRFGGTGLGLNITRSLVELMGGSIDVTSEDGRGSTFRVHLTLKSTDLVPPLSRGSLAPDTLSGKPAGSNILLIEDNPDNQLLLRHILVAEGHRVTIANNGEEGASAATEGRSYDLIISDIEMPRMDGFECAAEIRRAEKKHRRRPVPILALTAHALKGYREKCLSSGMSDYLTKPVKRQTLIDAVDQLLKPAATTLIVDDFPDSRILLEHFVRLAGTTDVVSAETGEQALDLARSNSPHLVLLDVDLPDRPGWEVAEQLLRVCPQARIVVMSGHEDQKTRDRCAAAGCEDYLVKPVSKDQVHRLLARFFPH